MRRLAAALVATAAVALFGAPIGAAEPASTGWVAVIGDFGNESSAERDVAILVERSRPDAIVTTGDNLYTDATYGRAVGGYYCAFIGGAATSPSCPRSSMARVNKFFPATGNHDYSNGGIADFRGYFRALRGLTSYAVTVGAIEFLIADSQAALDSPESMARQQRWVRMRATSSTAQWQVVVLHHPPYSSGSVHGSTERFRWPFAAWGVDLVLSGHDHEYERLKVAGTSFVVNGVGGADLYSFGSVLPGSLVRDSAHHGALFLRGTPASLTGEYRSTEGRVLDRFSVPTAIQHRT